MGFLPPEREPDHPCRPPAIRPWFRRWLEIGQRWQCDTCEQIWVVSGPNTPRHPQVRWVKWRPMPKVGPGPAQGARPRPPKGTGGIVTRREP